MNTINARISELKEEIRELSHAIHSNPELGNEEYDAVKRQSEMLKKHGFTVETGIGDLPTAYRASYKSAMQGPVIGFIAEYDALPGIGHGCGHNLICSLAVCSAIAMKEAVDHYGGEVRVIGAPAEETTGGKTVLSEKGFYDDIDVAMMAHPGEKFARSGSMNAMESLQFEYFGKAAHAAADPERGINALDGVLGLFSSINAIRQHILPTARIHGIITDGGKAPNIVPDYACARFYLRAPTKKYLGELDKLVRGCAEGAAKASRARLEISHFEATYDDMVTNRALSREILNAMVSLGIDKNMDTIDTMGSSDIGNVSHRCPCTHEWFGITGDETIKTHTEEFAKCADSDYAYESLFLTAEAFVMTGEKILKDPDLLKEIRDEFVKKEKKNER